MAALASALGVASDSGTYASRSSALKAAINTQLWDDTTGAYRLSREIPNAYPQDANATAVLTGIASPDQARRAMTYLQRTSWSRYGALTVAPSTPNPAIQPFYEPLPSGFEASGTPGPVRPERNRAAKRFPADAHVLGLPTLPGPGRHLLGEGKPARTAGHSAVSPASRTAGPRRPPRR